ncbi:MAG: metallophosphoesterase [Nocardioidaceae bacterium]
MRHLRSALLGASTAAVGSLVYAVGVEPRAYKLRRVEVPVLPPGSRPLRVLHLSDVHMTPRQTAKQRWLRSLADLEPDLVVNTGDNLAAMTSVPVVLRAYGELLDLPGVFVFGSNDYFAPTVKNPARYLLPGDRTRQVHGQRLPWRDLRDAMVSRGWTDLTNRVEPLDVAGLQLSFVGVDDPHLGYDDLAAVSGPADPDADLTIGVAHAPYLRVLDSWNRDGYSLIFAGHTHGGQLRLPGYGALVTNCDLDRGRARGLHTHAVAGRPPSWLHVSAGLGTSPFAPVRFYCRPEASLVTLTPIRDFPTAHP